LLDIIITNKTRIKLLLKFFLNSETTSYLRKLESEFGDSTNSIRIELNRMEKAGLLSSYRLGNKKIYRANTQHPLFNDLNSILKKNVGIDSIIEKVALKIGDLKATYLTGELARGIDSGTIELIFVGEDLDRDFITSLIKKAVRLVNRNINFTIMSSDIAPAQLKSKPHLLIWGPNI